MNKEEFIKRWKDSGLPPLEAASRLGVDPGKAFQWVREYRESLLPPKAPSSNGAGSFSLPKDLKDQLYLALLLSREARDYPQKERLPSGVLMALSALASLLPQMEEAWWQLKAAEVVE